MPKKDSKNQKKRIGIKETLAGADTLLMEKQLKEQIEAPMVRLSYAYAMDVVQAKLKMINADLTEQFDRQVIRSMTGRIKQTDSIAKKLMRKGREVTFQAAVTTLNDIAGIRVVCFFCDDIYRVADYNKKAKGYYPDQREGLCKKSQKERLSEYSSDCGGPGYLFRENNKDPGGDSDPVICNGLLG